MKTCEKKSITKEIRAINNYDQACRKLGENVSKTLESQITLTANQNFPVRNNVTNICTVI